MTPAELSKAIQSFACNELLGPARIRSWISVRRQPGKDVGTQDKEGGRGLRAGRKAQFKRNWQAVTLALEIAAPFAPPLVAEARKLPPPQKFYCG